MIEEKIMDKEYMLKLDEEVKKGNIYFISLVRDRFIKSLLCKNILFLKKFLIYVLNVVFVISKKWITPFSVVKSGKKRFI